jgi:outer membrane protein OmpA-like peptidoglycan-associated protein
MAVLLDRVNALKGKLTAQKKACETQVEKIKSDAERQQATAIEKLMNEQQGSCGEQLATIKDAFRAKLERVTYEDKRKKSVQQLFEPGEVEIHSNMDGSLLLRLSKLKFAPGKVELNSQNFEFLSRVKEALSLYDDRLVSINGHTDNQGDVKENQNLSLKRAEAVMDFLVSSGISKESLKAFGYGEIQPIASNDFSRGRDMNRRIDIVIEAPVTAQDDTPKE